MWNACLSAERKSVRAQREACLEGFARADADAYLADWCVELTIMRRATQMLDHGRHC